MMAVPPTKKIHANKRLPRRRQARAASRASGRDVIKQLGTELQDRRVALGITQKRFAELSGLQIATIGRIETGDLGVKLASLKKYLDLMALQLRPEEAVDAEDAE